MKTIVSCLSFFLFTSTFLFAENEIHSISTKCKLDEVTVYFNGAMLVHSAQVRLPEGTSKINITGVSTTLNENYVHVFASNEVKILAVNAKHDYLQNENKPSFKVKLLMDSLKLLKNQLSTCEYNIADLDTAKILLNDNQRGLGRASAANIIELDKLLSYVLEKKNLLNQKLIFEQTKRELLNENISKFENELFELNASTTKASCELIITVQTTQATTADLKISYVTSNAGWQPNYDLLVDEISKPITLKYKAKVFNSTDVDWDKVKLNLSTSNPFESADKPNLTAWYLNYNSNDYRARFKNYIQQSDKEKMQSQLNTMPGVQANGTYMWWADSIKTNYTIPIGKSKAAIEKSNVSYNPITIPELAMNYSIKEKYSIPSDSKPYDVDVMSTSLKAQYEYYTVPKLDDDAYLLAKIADWADLNLADGPANIFFKNNYVGKSSINAASTDDTLLISLGKDNKIVTTRTLKKEFSSKKMMSNSVSENFSYEIVVRNNNKDAVQVELQDQVPISQTNEIEVTIKNISGAIKDEQTGILDWKLILASGETKKFVIEYAIKHPKYKSLNFTQTPRKVIYCPSF